MNIASFGVLDPGLFVSDQVHQRDVTLADGSKHTLYFRELTTAQFRRFGLAERSSDEAIKAGSIAMLIACSLCGPDGKLALTEEQAAKLKPAVALAIADAVLDVNGVGAGEPGNG